MLLQKIKSVQDLVYNPELRKKVNTASILIIGVGGIGCELLKVLTNSGYRKLTILDFDTIEVTNLNRQFYFRREHVGMSKAQIGKESVLKKDPTLDITAIHDTIFADRFDIVFYQSFDLIFCALDNNAAREHLGRMCCMSNRVMIDAGTEGFNGQVTSNIRNISECNNCYPAKAPTTYAVCTIRATPSEPIHCVVYGMSLYKLLFGPKDPENHLTGLIKIEDISKYTEIEAIKIFDYFFHDLILKSSQEENDFGCSSNYFTLKYEQAINIQDIFCSQDLQQQQLLKSHVQQLQPFSYYAKQFVQAFIQITLNKEIGNLKFDKDDDLCIKFVTATTNMRTYNFKITSEAAQNTCSPSDKLKFLSEYQVKQMGGKVVSAIASTNAVAAALQCTESLKCLDKKQDDLRFIWITSGQDVNDEITQFLKLNPNDLPEPNDKCMVCGPRIIYVDLYGDFNMTKFQEVVDIMGILNIEKGEVMLREYLIYASEDEDLKNNNEKKKKQFLQEFNKSQDKIQTNPLKTIIFNIQQQNPTKYEFWLHGFVFKMILVHKEGMKIQLSQTKLNEIDKQRSKYVKEQNARYRQIRNALYEKYENEESNLALTFEKYYDGVYQSDE